ncbi:mycofactocin-coupled SDR family oxidoreductase [Mycolicibacterium palauense]|uniref:mycofactocin-coupled SDR family oxidoreductase n=1 Tax=Mycolicibacterium palauense TaxID=2034511 RepID=UPI000BFECF33|nr:mycofactocin-coupled SDR family oxidoreductase [Mycolicibacterium palauense]
MGRLEGKVAFITGAARGQGRSHATLLAAEGADIVAIDACRDFGTVPYPLATEDDLAQTAKEVESLGRRIIAEKVDVRDLPAMRDVAQKGLSELGSIDIVVANAGVGSTGSVLELGEQQWQELIDINLTGVWKTLVATVPAMLNGGRGGSVILVSSAAGLTGLPNMGHYSAAKHGVVGLMRTLSIELAPHAIRVNSINPTTVDTPMIGNQAIYELFTGVEGATREQAMPAFKSVNAMPIPFVDPVDVSNGVLYLASDEARYVTGTTLLVDAGATHAAKIPHQS